MMSKLENKRLETAKDIVTSWKFDEAYYLGKRMTGQEKALALLESYESSPSIGAKWARKMAEENEDMHDRLIAVAKILEAKSGAEDGKDTEDKPLKTEHIQVFAFKNNLAKQALANSSGCEGIPPSTSQSSVSPVCGERLAPENQEAEKKQKYIKHPQRGKCVPDEEPDFCVEEEGKDEKPKISIQAQKPTNSDGVSSCEEKPATEEEMQLYFKLNRIADSPKSFLESLRSHVQQEVEKALREKATQPFSPSELARACEQMTENQTEKPPSKVRGWLQEKARLLRERK